MPGLERLFRPRSVAIFGGNWAANVVEQCLKIGFDGEIWPVHPTSREVHGIACFRSVQDLPAPPDAAFIGVNRESTIGLLSELAKVGAGGAVCFASGFAEAEQEDSRGRGLQSSLIEAASGIPVLGPNCYGFVNYLDGTLLWPDQHGGIRCSSGVGIVTQSSNLAINLSMQQRGLPIGYIVTAGNQALLSQARIACELLEDPRVTAIGLHIEGFGDIGDYVMLAKKSRELRKPVVAIKAGRSEKTKAVTVSHTGSIVGSDRGADALLRRLGIGRVESVHELLEALKLLHAGGPLEGRRIGSMSCSGGEAGLVADAAVGRNLQFDDPAARHAVELRIALGPLVHIVNPLDYHTWHWGDERGLLQIYRAMLRGDYDLVLLVMDFPRSDRCSDTSWWPAVEAIIAASAEAGRRVAVVSTMPEGLPEHWAEKLFESQIVPLQGISEAIIAAEVAADIGERWRQPFQPPMISRTPTSVHSIVHNEAEIKGTLRKAGVSVPDGAIVTGEVEAIQVAERIGYPVVLKSLGVVHKTEAGAVELDLSDGDKLSAALSQMSAAGEFLVEEQVTGVVTELIVGVVRDPECGLLLTIGAGGVYTELFSDAQCLLLPSSAPEIKHALGNLAVRPILEGYRGAAGADIEALVQSVLDIAQFAERNAESLLELEINPLLALRHGAVAADALMRTTSGRS